MMELVKSAFSSKLFLVTSLLLLVYVYLKKVVFSYWKRHNVPHDDPVLILGTIDKELLSQKISMGTWCTKSYNKFKNHPFHGIYIFLQPTLMINDPDLIKNILIKDFSYFISRGMYFNEKIDPMSNNIFFLKGEKWRILREKFMGFFKPISLKKTFSILTEIVKDTESIVDELLMKSDVIDMDGFVDRYFVEVIFNIFFGVNTNSIRNPENNFYYNAKLAIRMSPTSSLAGFFAPKFLELFRIPFFNPKATDFFIKAFKDIVKKRKLENVKRDDFLEVLINMMDNEQIIEDANDGSFDDLDHGNEKLTEIEAIAQAFAFFIAGYETSSASMAFALMELSLNPDIQEKLHEEIDEFNKSSQELNFENLMNLPYLDMVLSETLRKHPPVPILGRICEKDYKIPNSQYTVPMGMRIIISFAAIHHNPDYYPEPEKFEPTRFSKENVANRHPCTYLPFSIGPRYCMGTRLAIVKIKLFLFTLLSNYKFCVCDETDLPIKYLVTSFVQKPENLYLKLVKKIV